MSEFPLPGVYYGEEVTYELTGKGSKIPVFIGETGNTLTSAEQNTSNYKIDGSVALKFSNINDVLRPVVKTGDDWKDKTGIGGKDEYGKLIPSNKLANVIYDFYSEAKLLQSNDIGVPYLYVIDIGDANDLEDWNRALKTAKKLYDSTVEVYVGADKIKQGNTVYSLTEFIPSVATMIENEAKDLNLRYGFVFKENATDKELKDLTNSIISACDDESVKKFSRMGLIEDIEFGKQVARICCTPNNIEPGFYEFRDVSPRTFKLRTKEDMRSLQNKGIIFGRDEYINGKVHPKSNLCVSMAFAYDSRPADSLFHARFNADDLLREVFEACYPQVKANESVSNIAYLQSTINKIINDRVNAEEMIKYNDRTDEGTRLIVSESTEKPYNLKVTGQIQPVKCTIAIEVEATIRL